MRTWFGRDFMSPLAVVSILLSWPAYGEVALAENDPDCQIRIHDRIASGDANVFRVLSEILLEQDRSQFRRSPSSLEGQWPRTVCLDSPGGNFVEGILIANMIQGRFATKLEPNANCYSACAIAFMAGSAYHPEEVLVDLSPEDNIGGWDVGPRRSMAPTSVLGFHAPFIDYSGRDSIPVGEAEEGMRGALALTGFLLASIKENFPVELAQEMLGKGRDEFFFVNEVGQLNAWDIDLSADYHPRLTSDLFQRAWITVAHKYDHGSPGYGSIGDTAFGIAPTQPKLGGASGWDYGMESGSTQSGAPYLLATGVGGEASFGAAFLDYGDYFQLRVLSSDFQTEYDRFNIQGWQLAAPTAKVSGFRSR